jgi:hypothetical protein
MAQGQGISRVFVSVNENGDFTYQIDTNGR